MDKKERTLNWIPLWVDKWLWGSTRIELIPEERSVFVDLLAFAAKDDGFIRANYETPYPHQQLAGMFLVTEELLTRTIAKCITLGKINEVQPQIYYITNWEEYQFTDRWKRHLKRQKRTEKEHSSSNAEQSSSEAEHSSSKAVRKGYNIIVNNSKEDNTKDTKNLFGEFNNVLLNEKEYTRLFKRLGSLERTKHAIEILSAYKESSGKKYKSDYATFYAWVIKELEQREGNNRGEKHKSEKCGFCKELLIESELKEHFKICSKNPKNNIKEKDVNKYMRQLVNQIPSKKV